MKHVGTVSIAAATMIAAHFDVTAALLFLSLSLAAFNV